MTDNEYALIELDKEVRHNEIVRQINERRRIDAEMSRLETLDKKIEEALEYSGITYADPIDWDNRRNFKSGTVVLNNGSAYLSKKFVPIGTPITDMEYWQPISVGDSTMVDIERAERVQADAAERVEREAAISYAINNERIERNAAILDRVPDITRQQADDLWEGR